MERPREAGSTRSTVFWQPARPNRRRAASLVISGNMARGHTDGFAAPPGSVQPVLRVVFVFLFILLQLLPPGPNPYVGYALQAQTPPEI